MNNEQQKLSFKLMDLNINLLIIWKQKNPQNMGNTNNHRSVYGYDQTFTNNAPPLTPLS